LRNSKESNGKYSKEFFLKINRKIREKHSICIKINKNKTSKSLIQGIYYLNHLQRREEGSRKQNKFCFIFNSTILANQ